MKKMMHGSLGGQIDLLEAPRELIYNWAKDEEFEEHLREIDKIMEKRKAIEMYMDYIYNTPEFKEEVKKSINHYLDTGEINGKQ